MNTIRIRQLLSYLLLALGAALVFLGARTLLEWRFGQAGAAVQFERSIADSSAAHVASSRQARLRAGETIAKLIIPRLHAHLYVVEGDGARQLLRGPGHLSGTALPGAAGNCVIAGHRDTHFRILRKIRAGDDIILQTESGQYLYRVRHTTIVTASNTSALQPTPKAVVNLITCFPFFFVGPAPKRFVVHAQLAAAVSGSQPSL